MTSRRVKRRNRLSRASPPAPAKAVERALPAALGTVLRGRFELVEVIGRGGLSTVYRAIDLVRRRARSADAEVALKVTDIGDGHGDDAAVLLHREGRRLMELSHPNIVGVRDFDRDGPLHFLVMELLQGRTLAQVLRERDARPLERMHAFAIVRALGGALDAVHRAGMVHGDVKPGNVFITRGGGVKLIDFGTAQPILPPDHRPEDDETVVFVQRLRAVTPAYASPALLAGHPAEPRDDLFSLAVLVYVLLAGRHPFDGRSVAAAMADRLSPKRPAGLSDSTWSTLRDALAFEPDQRPDGVAEFVRRLTRPRLLDGVRTIADPLLAGLRRLRSRIMSRRKPVKPGP